MLKNTLFFLSFALFPLLGYAFSIEEKKQALLENKSQINYEEKNAEIRSLYKKLEEEYFNAASLIESSFNQEIFTSVCQKLENLKEKINDTETAWQDAQSQDFHKKDTPGNIWEQGELTISKLIIEYGSSECLYVIPPEISTLKISMHGLFSIPKESWPKMIELILTHNNIGVKKVNPFLKQLYLLKEDFTNVETVTSEIKHMNLLDDSARVIHIYSPPLENIKVCFYFLDRFKNVKTTFVYQVGPKIAIVGLVKDIKKLLTLAENIWEKDSDRVGKIISPQKISAEDAVKFLNSYFGGLTDYSKSAISMKGGINLSAFTLKGENSIALIGSEEIVGKAENLLLKMEGQVHDPSEVILYWYQCSHCKPVDLAEILSKVYTSLTAYNIDIAKDPNNLTKPAVSIPSPINSKHIENFFPYPETNSILMTVRKNTLDKLKEIIKKIDRPKKMVEIEVLLCERRFASSNKSGINLLKLGGGAKNVNSTTLSYNGSTGSKGIIDFLFSSEKNIANNIPAIDLSYNFLLSQEDIVVTASPSTTTLNQIPTTLSITDQISVYTGRSYDKKCDTDKDVTYAREDFGITITLTPTIHEPELDGDENNLFITLENDIKFETITSNEEERPKVHKRHIQNTVRIADGQTVIIGGLRSNSIEELSQKIPFLGEIPGFAKVFGSNQQTNKNSEMFIFIKPTILSDPTNDLIKIRDEKLRNRPGETEYFFQLLNESRANQRKWKFQESLELFLGNGNLNEQKL